MKSVFFSAASLFLIPVLFLACGCGEGVRFPVVPASGKLTFEDGSPLPVGTQIVMNPVEGKVGIPKAETDAEGGFVLKHPSGSSGAEAGKYTVVLRPPAGGDGTFEKQVSRDYYVGDGAFAVEVKEGMPPIELKVKKSAVKR